MTFWGGQDIHFNGDQTFNDDDDHDADDDDDDEFNSLCILISFIMVDMSQPNCKTLLFNFVKYLKKGCQWMIFCNMFVLYMSPLT